MQRANDNLDFATGNAATAAGPYADLKRHLADGEVCAFVGAGLSIGAGLPGWYDLLAELAERIGYDQLPPRQWATGDALIDAAQAYVNRMGLHSLVAFLKERLDTTHVRPTARTAPWPACPSPWSSPPTSTTCWSAPSATRASGSR